MKKILVVDDEPNVVEMLTVRLESVGYEVISASNGAEGLEKTLAENPDLIILDIMMPVMDGYTFMKELKSKKLERDIPIIVLSAKDKMKDLFAVEGVRDYVTKPYNAAELLQKIEKHIQ